jgi:hypothetical protein
MGFMFLKNREVVHEKLKNKLKNFSKSKSLTPFESKIDIDVKIGDCRLKKSKKLSKSS